MTTRGQRRARREEITQAAMQMLPPELAPAVADRVFQQEAQANAQGVPFDAGSALSDFASQLREDAQRQQKIAQDEENDSELLLFGT